MTIVFEKMINVTHLSNLPLTILTKKYNGTTTTKEHGSSTLKEKPYSIRSSLENYATAWKRPSHIETDIDRVAGRVILPIGNYTLVLDTMLALQKETRSLP